MKHHRRFSFRPVIALLCLSCVQVNLGAIEAKPDEEIVEQEHLFYEALQKQDMEYIDSVLHDEFVFSGVGQGFGHMDRERYLATRPKQKIAEQKIKHLETTRVDNVVMVKITVSMDKTYQNTNVSGDYAVTAIWLNNDGKWKLLTRHISKLNK